MLRRLCAKTPSIKILVEKIFQKYLNLNYVGIFTGEDQAAQLQVAPLPGSPGRHDFKAALPPQGPVGLLLQTAHYMASAIDPIHHI
eukprot:8370390-Karenia_brevis.AAC.1